MLNTELAEFLKTIRTLKAEIEILTGINLKKGEKRVIGDAIEELSNCTLSYLRGFKP